MTCLRASVVALALLPLLALSGQSLSSCGATGDHESNAIMKVSPDPIQKGQPFSITASGKLDEGIGSGSFMIDLAISVEGIFKQTLTKTVPFTISAPVAQGAFELIVGPISLPSLPVGATVSGKVHIVDGKKEAVSCIALDLSIPAAAENVAPENVTSCGSATDHFKNLTFSDTGGVVSIAGTMDESVVKGEALIDLKIKASIINIPLKLTVPVSYTPGVAKGDLKITLGPVADLGSTLPLIDVDVSGTVKLNDASNEEIACIDIKSNRAAAPKSLLV